MNILVYKIIHLVGLILLFQALGASIFASMSGARPPEGSSRRLIGAMHGIGLVLLLVGGFGMLARLEIGFPFPAWTWVKLGIWAALGAAPQFAWKRPEAARIWWFVVLVLGCIAAYMGLFKPF